MDRHWFYRHRERVVRARISIQFAFIDAHRSVFGVRAMCRTRRGTKSRQDHIRSVRNACH
jgi:hypothetical protein